LIFGVSALLILKLLWAAPMFIFVTDALSICTDDDDDEHSRHKTAYSTIGLLIVLYVNKPMYEDDSPVSMLTEDPISTGS